MGLAQGPGFTASSVLGSSLPKGLPQPPWSPGGPASPPALLPSLGNRTPGWREQGGDEDPPEDRKEKSHLTHWHA